MSLSLCRVCLASNVRMHNIANTRYQDIFEKLSTQVCTDDNRPQTICYVCISQLRKCCTFIDMSRKAEEIFTQFSYSGIELTEDTINILDRKFVHKLTKTPLQYFSLNTIDIQVKIETKELINVKTDIIKKELVLDSEVNKANDIRIKKEVEVNESEESKSDNKTVTVELVQFKQEFIEDDNDTKLESSEKNYEVVLTPEKKEISKFKCTHCDKSYKHKFHLNRHIKENHSNNPTKNPERDFICEICGRGFYQKATLKKHILCHSGVKRYTCDVCHARFSQKNDLERHISSHTGRKPFTCDICKESYSRKSNLKLHIQTHAETKPYDCSICNSKFSRKYDLNRHKMRKHICEKPYSCDFCDFRSVNASYIKNHVENKHKKKNGAKPFECGKCDFKCGNSGYLKIHVQRKHLNVKTKNKIIKKL